MTCLEYEQKGLLYLSNELDETEKLVYENHLKQCSLCQQELNYARETLSILNKIPQEKPSPSNRNAILRQGKSRFSRKSMNKVLDLSWLPSRGLSLGLSAAMAIIIIMFLIFRPLNQIGSPTLLSEDILSWQDGLMEEMELLNSEIDRLESGILISGLVSFEIQSVIDENNQTLDLKTNLNQIQGEVEDLLNSLYEL
jgi:hypothetical protein